MTKQEFQAAFTKQRAEMSGYQVRFVAFVAHLGFKDAYAGTVASRNARFMNWIAERRADYYNAFGEYPLGCAAGSKPDLFTDFITNGDWIV